MRKILIIDKGDSSVQKFRKPLTNKGCLIINEPSIHKAAPLLKKKDLDLIVIDALLLSNSGSDGEFRKLSADIPKIILADRESARKNNLWRKDNLAVQINEPVSFKDFKYWSERLLKDKLLKDKNRFLLAEIKNIKKELKFHDDTANNLAEKFDLKKTLTSIMGKIAAMADAKTWSIILEDDPSFAIIPLRTSTKIQKTVFEKETGIAGWVHEKSIPVIVPNVQKDKRFSPKMDNLDGLKVDSLVCVPLKIKEGVTGVIRLINKKQPRSGSKPGTDQAGFTDDDMNLLVSAANYIGIAIERTFLYQKTKNDDLTNLYNSHYLNQALEIEIERSRRYRSMFSLVFMDLDNFKKVNDKYGHLIGSKVLIEMAGILNKSLRKIDVITRYGGDEFVIILPLTPPDAGFYVAERLRKAVEKNIFLKHEGFPIRLTASFGLASYPEHANNREELLKIADDAMYHGKFSTKNIVHSAKQKYNK
ncbi:MAG: sensor domain-containing diguanylate cyclase [Nitrospirota bacterium]